MRQQCRTSVEEEEDDAMDDMIGEDESDDGRGPSSRMIDNDK